jgi:hypothetical protein
MIIAFAFGLIGALLILANFRSLRKYGILLTAVISAIALAGLGIYLITHPSKESGPEIFFPFFTPLTALLLMYLTSLAYRKKYRKEIIFYIRNLFPVKHDERYVTVNETYITFALLILSVVLPYSILKIIL